jgi:hypothetical protein
VATHSEQIADGIVEGEKPLCLPCRFESAHLPFPLASQLMRGFGSIVGVPVDIVSHMAEDVSYCSGEASQFVSNDP